MSPSIALAVLGLIASAPTTPAPRSLDQAITKLVNALSLSSVRGYDPTFDTALLVRLERTAPKFQARAEGLLRARLTQHGVLGLMPISLAQEANPTEAATERGADWLITVRGRFSGQNARGLELHAELSAIDPGLWAPAGPISIYASATITQDQPNAPPPPPPAQASLPELLGPPIKINERSSSVVALAACSLLSSELEQLVVLNSEALEVFSFAQGRLRPLARLELGALPRSASPAREPLGTIRCGPDRIAFGHSDLASGYVLSVQRTSSPDELRLSVLEPLDGLPILSGTGGWIVAKLEAGTSRYGRQLQRSTRGTAEVITAQHEYLELEPIRGQPRSLIGVTEDYRLVRLDKDLKVRGVLGTSGVGACALSRKGQPFVLTTSTELDAAMDRLTILTLVEGRRHERDAMAIEGQVFACATGAFRSPGRTDVIVAAQGPDHSALLSLELRWSAP